MNVHELQQEEVLAFLADDERPIMVQRTIILAGRIRHPLPV